MCHNSCGDIIANKAAKRPTTIQVTPVDIFEDTWGYF